MSLFGRVLGTVMGDMDSSDGDVAEPRGDDHTRPGLTPARAEDDGLNTDGVDEDNESTGWTTKADLAATAPATVTTGIGASGLRLDGLRLDGLRSGVQGFLGAMTAAATATVGPTLREQQLEDELARTNQLLEELERGHRNELTQLTEMHRAAMAQAIERNTALEARLHSSLPAIPGDTDEHVRGLEVMLDQSQKDRLGLEASVEPLNETNRKLMQRLQELSTSAATSAAASPLGDDKLAEAHATIERLNNDLELERARAADIDSQARAREALSVQTLQQQIEHLHADLSLASGRIEQAREEARCATERAISTENLLAREQQTVSEMCLQRENDERHLKQLRKDIEALQTTIKQHQDHAATSLVQFEVLQRQADEQSTQYRIELGALEGQLEHLQQEADQQRKLLQAQIQRSSPVPPTTPTVAEEDAQTTMAQLLRWIESLASSTELCSDEMTATTTVEPQPSPTDLGSKFRLVRTVLDRLQQGTLVVLRTDVLERLQHSSTAVQQMQLQLAQREQQLQRLSETLSQEQHARSDVLKQLDEAQTTVVAQKAYIETLVEAQARASLETITIAGLTESGVQELLSRQNHDQAELQRLRAHLISSEESFTQEILELDQKAKQLEHELQLSRQSSGTNESNIGEHVSTTAMQQLQEKHDGLIASLLQKSGELDRAQLALSNLQAVLDQLQAEHQLQLSQVNETASATVIKIREELRLVELREQPLRETITILEQEVEKTGTVRAQLRDAQSEIRRLQLDSSKLQTHLEESLSRLNDKLGAGASSDQALDRSLMKNLLLSYVIEKEPKKGEILNVLVKILGYEERERSMITAASRPTGILGTFFRGMSPSGAGGVSGLAPTSDVQQQQSFSELWIQFLLNEAKKIEEKDNIGSTGSSSGA